MPEKTFFNWSSGKDSALALYHLLRNPQYSVEHLLTSVNAHHDRVSMHGLRRTLLTEQLEAVGLPYGTVELPENPTNVQYETCMKEQVEILKKAGFSHAGFGDIYLEDLRSYREQQLASVGIQAVFPLWKRDTRELLEEFWNLGFRAITVCVNGDLLGKEFAGKELDRDFISALPEGVDVCGENGEFHTFCYDGPIFKRPVDFTKGDVVYKGYTHEEKESGYWFCDLLPVTV